MRRRRPISLLCLIGSLLAMAATAGAASADVQLTASAYWAHENQGTVTVTISRSDPRGDEYVRYGVRRMDALPGVDFVAVPNTVAHFADGQSTFSFTVQLLDRHIHGSPVSASVYLFGSWPYAMGAQQESPIHILRDDPLHPRSATNPLALSPAPTNGDPLSGARFFVDQGNLAAVASRSLQRTNPGWAQALSVIAAQPETRRFGSWDGNHAGGDVQYYLSQSQLADPGAIPLIAAYRLVGGQCGKHADSPAQQASYRRWIDNFAWGIGNFRAVLFLEMDSLITAGCLSPQGLQIRFGELRYAIARLEQDPHLVIYLDGGAADAASWSQDASLLARSGIKRAQGFFLNSTHFDWTKSELVYGQRIARALGGVHFVVSTAVNGRGPLVPANRTIGGNEVLCNPSGRGLGPLATGNPGYRYADGFAWIGNPGRSGGACVPGAPNTGAFWPAYAVGLAQHANFNVTGPRGVNPTASTVGAAVRRAPPRRTAAPRAAPAGLASPQPYQLAPPYPPPLDTAASRDGGAGRCGATFPAGVRAPRKTNIVATALFTLPACQIG